MYTILGFGKDLNLGAFVADLAKYGVVLGL